MKKPALIRLMVVAGIIAGAMTFQNCGPTFVTNEQGQIMMSSFEGPIEIPRDVPSQVKSDFPSKGADAKNRRSLPTALKATNTAQTSNCGSGLVSYCGAGTYLTGGYSIPVSGVR